MIILIKKDLHYAMKIKRNGETIISGDLHTHPVPVGAKRMAYTVKLSHEEVVNASCFMLSALSSGITGAIIPVDSGYGIMGI